MPPILLRSLDESKHCSHNTLVQTALAVVYFTPILAAMTVGFIMLSVSISQQRIDPPLNKEFVRDGRGYSIDESMIENARALGLSADLRLDTQPAKPC